jgi:predicted nucleic acid-binding protein
VISIDTNLLLYGLNRDCPEHAAARAFLEDCADR